MAADVVDPDVTAQQRLTHVVRALVSPRLRSDGFARSGHTWRRGDAEQGWVLVQLQGNRYNTADRLEVTVNTAVWPAGTWDVHCAVAGQDAADRPYVAGDAPVFARPREIAPDLAPEGSWWHLDAGTDLAQWGAQLVEFVAGAAVPWGVGLLDAEAAVERLTTGGRVWDLVYALGVLGRARSHQVAAVAEDLTRVWVADPRPITLRPHLLEWRRTAGLPDVALPEVWSPSMAPEMVTRFGSAEAARAAGVGVWMHSWDGRSWQDRP